MAITKTASTKTAAKKPAAAKEVKKDAAKVEKKVAPKKEATPKKVTGDKGQVTGKVEAKASVAKPEIKKETKTEAKAEVKAPAPAVKEKKDKTAKKPAPYVSNGEIRVELAHGVAGCTKKQIRTVQALGLKKTGDVRVHKDNPAIQGMIRVVAHLVRAEKIVRG